MSRVQVSVIYLLLKVMFHFNAMQLLDTHNCPTCPQGYFLVKNCSDIKSNNEWISGIQCKPCTVCSDMDQDTLIECSTVTDSVCGHTPTKPPESAPDKTMFLTVIVLSVFLILLLTLCLTIMFCQKGRQKLIDPDNP